MLDDKCCGTCKYHYHKNIGDGWECVNDRSEYFADWTEYSDSCDEWEGREQMKYKVGDKVRVRKDLVCGEQYGELFVRDSMCNICGETVTIDTIYDRFYRIVECEYCWTDEMFEGLVEDELTAEEAIKIFGKICCETRCTDECPIYKAKKGMSCRKFRKDKPEEVLEILKQRKKEHEKKEIKTEIVDLIKVMKEVCDDETCIYAYEIDTNEEDVDEKMNELVKQYYEENGGKIYAKFERLCRVKS